MQKPSQELVPPLIEAAVQQWVAPDASVRRIEHTPMAGHERGWSGADVRRYRVTLGDGEVMSLILKTASLKERRVQMRLTEQGHACVPRTLALVLMSPEHAWMCMQDVAGDGSTAVDLARQVARGLAEIHVRNLGCRDEVAWLPRADTAYFRDFLVAQVWRDNWENQIARYPEFAAEFEHYTARLDVGAQQFIADMDSLWQAGDSLTITHGDLHPADGSHIIVHQGRPYFIDWGWAYYGSFYLDLPNVFTRETVVHYREALAELGHDVPLGEFWRAMTQRVDMSVSSTSALASGSGRRGQHARRGVCFSRC